VQRAEPSSRSLRGRTSPSPGRRQGDRHDRRGDRPAPRGRSRSPAPRRPSAARRRRFASIHRRRGARVERVRGRGLDAKASRRSRIPTGDGEQFLLQDPTEWTSRPCGRRARRPPGTGRPTARDRSGLEHARPDLLLRRRRSRRPEAALLPARLTGYSNRQLQPTPSRWISIRRTTGVSSPSTRGGRGSSTRCLTLAGPYDLTRTARARDDDQDPVPIHGRSKLGRRRNNALAGRRRHRLQDRSDHCDAGSCPTCRSPRG